ETFTLANAPAVLNWATSQGIAELSFWALQRDNGGCPGGAAADNCSGVSQSTWQFSHVFEPFSGGTVSPSPTSTRTSSPSPSPTPTGADAAWAPNHAYVVGDRVSYQGRNYQCLQSHTSMVGWEPPNVPALWKAL